VQEAVPVVNRQLIAQTVNVVVRMASITGGRKPRVISIDRVAGMTDGEYVTAPLH
jgi:Flp pilus assembly CpaF family ATPase